MSGTISWNHIATTVVHHGGGDTITQKFTTLSGATQAVRVQLRKGGDSPVPCSDSNQNSWNDRVR